MTRAQKLYAIESRTRLARLIEPVDPAILRMKNRSVTTHHPSLTRRYKRKTIERHLRLDELLMPGIPSILAPENRPIGSNSPALLLVEKEDG